MKKILMMILCFITVLSSVSVNVYAEEIIQTHKTLNHTQNEIARYYHNALINDENGPFIYKVEPNIKAPYKAGQLKDEVTENILKQINLYRWLSGLNNITINEQYMERSQKGAVIQAALNELTHYPDKPDDMSEEFFNEACLGTGAGTSYSGNCAYGHNIYAVIKNYIDEEVNLMKNVGHRLSILDPQAVSTSFGFAHINSIYYYNATSIYTDRNLNVNTDKYYAWPCAGNMPTELMNKNALWSIKLIDNYDTSNLDLYIKYNNKIYDITDIYYDYMRNAISFSLPENLLSLITDNNGYINGKEVQIYVKGLVTNGKKYTITYPVRFFNAEDIVLSHISLNKTSVHISINEQIKLNASVIPNNDTVTWTSSNNSVVSVDKYGIITAKSTGKAKITATSSSGLSSVCQVTVHKKPFPFTDVSENQWYYSAVRETYDLGLLTGATNTLFKPNANMNRAMVAIVFHRMEGSRKVPYSNQFSDVKDNQYYTTSVLWAKQSGVINGYKDGTFKPTKNVTREEMATMICNFAKYKGLNVKASKDITGYSDYHKITAYAREPMQWAVEKGLMSGKDNGTRLDPLGNATRAECSKMLLQAYKLIYK